MDVTGHGQDGWQRLFRILTSPVDVAGIHVDAKARQIELSHRAQRGRRIVDRSADVRFAAKRHTIPGRSIGKLFEPADAFAARLNALNRIVLTPRLIMISSLVLSVLFSLFNRVIALFSTTFSILF